MENRGFGPRTSPLPQLSPHTKHKNAESGGAWSLKRPRDLRAPIARQETRVSRAPSHVTVGQHVHVHVRHGLARELAVLHAELEAARLVPGLEHALHLAH